MSAPLEVRIVSLAECPDALGAMRALARRSYPPFLLDTPVSVQYWEPLLEVYSACQFSIWAAAPDAGEVLVGAVHAVPIAWGGVEDLPPGWDAAVRQSRRRQEPASHALCALSIVLDPEVRSTGLATQALRQLHALAKLRCDQALVAPVRPTRKHEYPLVPMKDYARWRRPDGLPFDPWLRCHVEVGGEIVRVAPRSMVCTGTVAQWESWTGMTFPGSGRYLVEGALSPVSIDRSADTGRYIEPNVWVLHRV